MVGPILSILNTSTQDIERQELDRQEYLAQSVRAHEAAAAAEDEEEKVVASLWYLSSIESLQPSQNDVQEVNQLGIQPQERSSWSRFTSWLWGVFGKTEEIAAAPSEADEKSHEAVLPPLPGKPILPSAEMMSNDRISKAIADLNKDLLHRLKETAQFEEEMLKSDSRAMDRLILVHLVAKSLDQKKLKEEAGLEAHELILRVQKLNKELSEKRYNLLDDFNSAAKKHSILHWVNIGTGVGIAGTMVMSFMTGGTSMVFAIALPALNLMKGGFSAAEGLLKYDMDLRTGQITMFNHEMRTNRGQINDRVNGTLPQADEEISHLLKTIRQHLENYGKEARIHRQ